MGMKYTVYNFKYELYEFDALHSIITWKITKNQIELILKMLFLTFSLIIFRNKLINYVESVLRWNFVIRQ